MAEQDQSAQPATPAPQPQAEPYPMNLDELKAKLKQQYPSLTDAELEAFGL
jgi:hypothetical protein